jgi:rhodanese-related sulfurtransferase
MKKIFLIILSVFLLACSAGCSDSAESNSKAPLQASGKVANGYREVSANEAAQLINNEHPFILDVRTPGEYSSGHLQNAVLIPVQELQGRLKELAAYKDREILIYCASGYRSKVASKILIDNDFKQIANMRHGIYEWVKKNLPVVR